MVYGLWPKIGWPPAIVFGGLADDLYTGAT
jgi:hypothetical protein